MTKPSSPTAISQLNSLTTHNVVQHQLPCPWQLSSSSSSPPSYSSFFSTSATATASASLLACVPCRSWATSTTVLRGVGRVVRSHHIRVARVPLNVVVTNSELAKQVLKENDQVLANRQHNPFAAKSSQAQDLIGANYGPHYVKVWKVCTLELFTLTHLEALRPIREDEVTAMVKSLYNDVTSPVREEFAIEEAKQHFFDALLTLKDEYELSEDTIIGLLCVWMDTTAICVEWATFDNPRVQQKAQEELDRVVGSESVMTKLDLSRLPYLQCVAKEAMRLHPPTPLMLPHQDMEEAPGVVTYMRTPLEAVPTPRLPTTL